MADDSEAELVARKLEEEEKEMKRTKTRCLSEDEALSKYRSNTHA